MYSRKEVERAKSTLEDRLALGDLDRADTWDRGYINGVRYGISVLEDLLGEDDD